MPNTLTGIIPTFFQALNIVSREQVGLINAVFRNSGAEQAALNQDITYPVASARSAINLTPAVTVPDSGDETVGSGKLTITKSRGVPIRWNGEEQKAVQQTGVYNALLKDQFMQAIRTIGNEVEADLAALATKFSRAYGTAGTTPFATAADLSDFAQTKKILIDNGCGQSDLRMVYDTTAGASLEGKHSELFKVSEAGSDELLRQGMITRLQGFGLAKSAQVGLHTKGTGTGYLVNNGAGYAVGATTIAVDTGSGTILAGDVITFTGDTNKYLVTTAVSGGSLAIAAPGLRMALADNVALTVGNNFTANMAFDRMAMHLVTRAPALPLGPSGKPADAAQDIAYITDPMTGLVYQVTLYGQFRQATIIVGLAWGVGCTKPENTAILLG
jgi:predicted transglutaminase-like cysteine proteinase